MIGCTRSAAIRAPFIAPIPSVTLKPITMATGVPFARLVAVTAEAIAISEPTERSIPPVATT